MHFVGTCGITLLFKLYSLIFVQPLDPSHSSVIHLWFCSVNPKKKCQELSILSNQSLCLVGKQSHSILHKRNLDFMRDIGGPRWLYNVITIVSELPNQTIILCNKMYMHGSNQGNISVIEVLINYIMVPSFGGRINEFTNTKVFQYFNRLTLNIWTIISSQPRIIPNIIFHAIT